MSLLYTALTRAAATNISLKVDLPSIVRLLCENISRLAAYLSIDYRMMNDSVFHSRHGSID